MPELAEVETVRKYLDRILKNKKIKEVVVDDSDKYLFAYAKPAEVVKALTGAKVKSTGRKGKYFWLQLNREPGLILHLGMTGNISVLLSGSKKPHQNIWGGLNLQSESAGKKDPKRLWFCRLLIKLSDGTEVGLIDPRRFAKLWLSEDPENHPRIKKLGWDPLIDFPSAKVLQDKIFKRKIPIKSILLEQKIFAGIGNWLADEILFQAKISPRRLASDLSLKDVTALRKAILLVVKKAVKVDADYERFPKSWLFHYRWGKSKTAKVSTGQKIIHEEIGGRTAAWVPSVQK